MGLDAAILVEIVSKMTSAMCRADLVPMTAKRGTWVTNVSHI